MARGRERCGTVGVRCDGARCGQGVRAERNVADEFLPMLRPICVAVYLASWSMVQSRWFIRGTTVVSHTFVQVVPYIHSLSIAIHRGRASPACHGAS